MIGGQVVPAGRRTRHVTVQAYAESRQTTGFPAEAWTDLFTTYMSREEFGGQAAGKRERFVADQQAATAESRWQMPFRPDMDPERIDVPKMRRLVYQGRTYNITAATTVGNRAAVEVLTQAAVG